MHHHQRPQSVSIGGSTSTGNAVGRRELLIGSAAFAAAPVMTAAAAADDADATSAQADAIWREHQRLCAARDAAELAYHEASDRVPAWAAPGCSSIRPDGALSGPRGWPLVERPEFAIMTGDGELIIRPDAYDIRASFEERARMWPAMRSQLRADYRVAMRAFVARCRRRDAEYERVKETGLATALEDLCNAVRACLDRLRAMPRENANVTAALILGEIADGDIDEFWLTVIAYALAFMRPRLVGAIAAAADEFLADPLQEDAAE